jgi:hypothetical protein
MEDDINSQVDTVVRNSVISTRQGFVDAVRREFCISAAPIVSPIERHDLRMKILQVMPILRRYGSKARYGSVVLLMNTEATKQTLAKVTRMHSRQQEQFYVKMTISDDNRSQAATNEILAQMNVGTTISVTVKRLTLHHNSASCTFDAMIPSDDAAIEPIVPAPIIPAPIGHAHNSASCTFVAMAPSDDAASEPIVPAPITPAPITPAPIGPAHNSASCTFVAMVPSDDAASEPIVPTPITPAPFGPALDLIPAEPMIQASGQSPAIRVPSLTTLDPAPPICTTHGSIRWNNQMGITDHSQSAYAVNNLQDAEVAGLRFSNGNLRWMNQEDSVSMKRLDNEPGNSTSTKLEGKKRRKMSAV